MTGQRYWANSRPRANNWHVKNYRHREPAPVWDGDIDYDSALAVMVAAGYRGWVGIESYFGDVLDLQARSLRYLKDLVAAAELARQKPRESVV